MKSGFTLASDNKEYGFDAAVASRLGIVSIESKETRNVCEKEVQNEEMFVPVKKKGKSPKVKGSQPDEKPETEQYREHQHEYKRRW